METFDVITFLDDKGIEYFTEGKNISSGWIGIHCPFCEDFSTHGGINLSSKAFSCFRCGEKANAIKLVAKLLGISQKQASGIVKRYFDLKSIISPKEKVYSNKVKLPLAVTKNFESAYIDYLEKRKFNSELLIAKYDLFAGGLSGDFKFRIVAPVYLDRQLVTFVGRDITGLSDKRYKNLANELSVIPCKQTLYNIDSVRDTAIVVEGIFDVWRIGDGCVATFGTAITNEQILLLKDLRRVFILYDYDAIKPAEHLFARLSVFIKDIEIIKLDAGDPAEMSEDDVLHLRRELKI